MAIDLSSAVLRRSFLLLLALIALLIVWQASELWFSDVELRSGEPAKMERAATLLPGNAEIWDRLGRYYLFNFDAPSISTAIADFQKALQVDPLSEDYWIDLANAYDASGDDSAAQQAYEHARSVYPTSTLIDWNYGNFLLREGRTDEAFTEIHRAVVGTPALLPLAMSRVWRSTGDVSQLLDRIVPADTDSYLTALNFFSSIRQIQPGIIVFDRLIALKQPLPIEKTFEFFEELIRENDGPDARRLWNDTVAAVSEPQLEESGESVLSDGSFQVSFPNGGLGWRWAPEMGTSIDFDPSTPNGKGRSVRLDFSGGANTDVNEPAQYVVVEPSRTYRFHASMRTDQITTDSGMAFFIFDADQNGLNYRTTNMTGTHGWTNVDLDVTTGSQTHFLCIQLSRRPSTFFDNKLGGSVWIADVSLIPNQTDVGQARP
jgi:tetratricopeptide (TPR) repeat protein